MLELHVRKGSARIFDRRLSIRQQTLQASVPVLETWSSSWALTSVSLHPSAIHVVPNSRTVLCSWTSRSHLSSSPLVLLRARHSCGMQVMNIFLWHCCCFLSLPRSKAKENGIERYVICICFTSSFFFSKKTILCLFTFSFSFVLAFLPLVTFKFVVFKKSVCFFSFYFFFTFYFVRVYLVTFDICPFFCFAFSLF